MIQLLGNLALGLAIISTLIQSIAPLLKLRHVQKITATPSPLFVIARSAAFAQFISVLLAYLLLTIGFVTNDFSLIYVAENSHASLPIIYKLTAVWSGHEGSILLWIVILNGWTIVYTYTVRRHKKITRDAVTFSVLGIISFSFLCFLTFTSNPFVSTNLTLQGADLNPLLQDPGLACHPPLLYIGYVGLAVAFAITQAALICKQVDAAWARSTRQFATASWCFLTIGIALGSWWAYRVLGWGGFWFWDPVENASLLPWLADIALIHVMFLVEKKGHMKIWAIALINTCFVLSLLGTFLVRSGILISAHSFASDPQRGIYLLIMLGIYLLGSAWLLIRRTSFLTPTVPTRHISVTQTQSNPIEFLSHDANLLYSSALFIVAMLTILLGTLYPLIADALNMGSISVGAPYFNTVMVPLICVGLFFMGLAAWREWQPKSTRYLRTKHSVISILCLLLGGLIVTLVCYQFPIDSLLLLSLCLWVITSAAITFKRAIAMSIAHAGFAILIIAITLSSVLTQEHELKMQPGDKIHVGPYGFLFGGIQAIINTQYQSIQGTFVITKDTDQIINLYPEKRIYRERGVIVTKVAIDTGLFRDLYIALGQPLDRDYWSVNIYYKPFICWIWIGAGLITLGGILSILTRKKHD